VPSLDFTPFDGRIEPAAPDSVQQPPVLNVRVFPETLPDATYPEQSNPKYSAASGKWGACFSGGGPRACAAALGQMRGLYVADAVQYLGAISCVSGGSWFGAPFCYSTMFTDAELLGEYLDPNQITLGNIAAVQPYCIGTGLLNLGNINLAYIGTRALLRGIPADKLWSRMMNAALLAPFTVDGTDRYVALDQDDVDAIIARNTELSKNSFYTLRPSAPYFIAGGTYIGSAPSIAPSGDLHARPGTAPLADIANAATASLPGQVYRTFEYTAAYTGTPQRFSDPGRTFGGGYVENTGFATGAPAAPPRNGIVSAGTKKYPFLLSDMIGSSSSAFASVAVELGVPAIAPRFDYWSPATAGTETAKTETIGDGGILENIGIVPLLRRGYRTILAFVNSPYPIGSTDDGCVDGVDGQISRLFGLIPANDFGNSQNTQIFARAKWQAVANGLAAAKAAGGPTTYADTYAIEPNNPFGIPPYPGDGEVRIVWLYNDLNQRWYNQLPSDVQAAIQNQWTIYPLYNLPNFWTVGQNYGMLLYYTPEQINLLAHMWAYTVKTLGVGGLTDHA
jgi:hypothetical protein